MIGLSALLVAALVAAEVIPPGDLDPCLRGRFREITQTSVTGEIIGVPDRKDWGCAETAPGSPRAGASEGIADQAPGVAPPLPPATCLEPAFPNPTQDSTSLKFSLAQAARVSVVVYGQSFRHGPLRVFAVRTLMDGEMAAGLHMLRWDLADEGGARVPPGIYRVVMKAAGDTICGDIEVR